MNSMKYIMKISFAFGILLCTASIKSFDGLKSIYPSFEEHPALYGSEIEQFGFPLEPWAEPLFGGILEQNISELSSITPPVLEQIELHQLTSSTSSIQEENNKKKIACNHPGCTYAANDKSHLKIHRRIHTKEKPYACDYPGCNHTTSHSSAFIIHKRTHTKEKPYVCNFTGCNYATGDSSNIIRHKRIHSGKKPHKCDHPGCNYATSDRSALVIHKHIHIGEKRGLV